MDVLWASQEEQSVRDVHTQLLADARIAYTTVMTVLGRLAKKHVVVRQPEVLVVEGLNVLQPPMARGDGRPGLDPREPAGEDGGGAGEDRQRRGCP